MQLSTVRLTIPILAAIALLAIVQGINDVPLSSKAMKR